MQKKKSLFANFIYNALYNSLSIIFPLITIPYVSRILLSDGLGKINYASNIVAWFLLFASLGIPRYGVREIARVKGDKNSLDQTFSSLFCINFVSSCICSIAFVALTWVVPYFNNKLVLYLVSGIQLFLNVFNVDWFYQGMEEYGYITERSFAIKICSLAAMFMFVRTHDDYITYALIQSIALVGSYLLNFINLRKYVHFVYKKLTIKKHLKSIFILLSTQLAVNIYSLLDTTMLGWWCTDSVIGYYTNVHKLIKIVAILTASLGSVMLPRLVNMYAGKDIDGVKKLSEKALDVIVVMCIPIMFGMILTSKDIVSVIFGTDFMPCIETMIIFAPFILFTTIGNLFGTQLLMVFGQEKKLLYSVAIGAVINFSLNSLLIRSMYQNGAALASVITECIVMVTQIIMVHKYIDIKLNFKSCMQVCVMTIGMIAIVLGVQYLISNTFIELILSVGLGALTYLTIGFVLKNEALVSLIDIFRSKIKQV